MPWVDDKHRIQSNSYWVCTCVCACVCACVCVCVCVLALIFVRVFACTCVENETCDVEFGGPHHMLFLQLGHYLTMMITITMMSANYQDPTGYS